MAIYVIDSNFLIQAHRAVYPLDIATGFWNTVKKLAIEGKIVSIDKVKNEIYKNNDELRGLLIIPFFQKTNIMNKMQGINFSE